MILKNNKPIEKTELDALRAEVRRVFPEFNRTGYQVIKYHPSRIKPDTANPGKVITNSNLPVVPAASVMTSDGDYAIYRYCKTYNQNNETKDWTYTPDMININKRRIVNDIDELVFLYHFCTSVEQCPAKRDESVVIMLTFENIELENKSTNDDTIQKAEYNLLLFKQMNEQKVRILGNSYNIQGSETMILEQLKRSIDTIVQKQPNGIANFMAKAVGGTPAPAAPTIMPPVAEKPKPNKPKTELPLHTEQLAALNKLYADGVLTYGTPRNKWVYEGEEIYNEMKQKDAGADKLLRFLQKNKPEVLEQLLSLEAEPA